MCPHTPKPEFLHIPYKAPIEPHRAPMEPHGPTSHLLDSKWPQEASEPLGIKGVCRSVLNDHLLNHYFQEPHTHILIGFAFVD